MFGGCDMGSRRTSNLKENQFLYDCNAAPSQLQLFGSTAIPAAGTTGYFHYTGNNHLPFINQSNKTNNDAEDARQLKLQISLSNFHLDDADRRISIPSAVSTGLKLSYEDDERNSSITSASGSMSSLPLMMSLGDSLWSEIDKQNKEIDKYIRIQEEKLIKVVKEMNQRQTVALLGAVEQEVRKKLLEKELEVEAMNRKNKELNDQIRQAALQVQSWQARALYNESVANSLREKLMQAIAQDANQTREGSGDNEADDAASCQIANVAPGAISQSSLVRSKKMVDGQVACRSCRGKEASVLLMPCRHLCLCAECERLVDVCPVCQFPKSGSVEINMS